MDIAIGNLGEYIRNIEWNMMRSAYFLVASNKSRDEAKVNRLNEDQICGMYNSIRRCVRDFPGHPNTESFSEAGFEVPTEVMNLNFTEKIAAHHTLSQLNYNNLALSEGEIYQTFLGEIYDKKGRFSFFTPRERTLEEMSNRDIIDIRDYQPAYKE